MTIRWGILSTGNIAHQFVRSFRFSDGGVLQGVASRTAERAEAFARPYGIPRSYASYKELAESDDIDAIYIGSPHTQHFRDAALCLRNGKHVLCEKPITMNEAQLNVLTDIAAENGCFLMEAIWSRFMPVYTHINNWLEHELGGTPEYLRADFGMYKEFDPDHRLFHPELGGGALLDVGFYTVWLAIHAFDAEPESIHTEARFLDNGTDKHVSAILNFPGGGKADMMCASQMASPTCAEIYGNGYRIEIDTEFHCPYSASLTRGEQTTRYHCRYAPHGYQFETNEVNRCIQEGLRESPALPLERSRQIMRTLDRMRAQIGLTYPEHLESAGV